MNWSNCKKSVRTSKTKNDVSILINEVTMGYFNIDSEEKLF